MSKVRGLVSGTYQHQLPGNHANNQSENQPQLNETNQTSQTNNQSENQPQLNQAYQTSQANLGRERPPHPFSIQALLASTPVSRNSQKTHDQPGSSYVSNSLSHGQLESSVTNPSQRESNADNSGNSAFSIESQRGIRTTNQSQQELQGTHDINGAQGSPESVIDVVAFTPLPSQNSPIAGPSHQYQGSSDNTVNDAYVVNYTPKPQ